MIKLKVSYETEQELADFLKGIRHNVGKIKVSTEQKGRYKRAYIDIHEQRAKPERTAGKSKSE